MSYEDYNKLLIKENNVSFMEVIYPQIKDRVRDIFKACKNKIVGEVRKDYNGFELMGLDFMID